MTVAINDLGARFGELLAQAFVQIDMLKKRHHALTERIGELEAENKALQAKLSEVEQARLAREAKEIIGSKGQIIQE